MLKKHLKKIVSLVLVTMMAIGMSITAIAAEPYQNELEAVMDTSPADSGQVTHYDTTTGEMLVEDKVFKSIFIHPHYLLNCICCFQRKKQP